MKLLTSMIAIGILAPAVALAEGINLAWDDCGSAGVSAKTFACDTNLGADILVGSFVPPEGIERFVRIDAILDIRTPGTLPDWWRHNDPPENHTLYCRDTTGMSVDGDFSGLVACADPYTGASFVGSGYDYFPEHVSMNRAFCGLTVEKGPPHTAMDPGTEYYAFRVVLAHDKATGDGACAGCDVAACIELEEVRVYETTGAVTTIISPIHGTFATWQSIVHGECPQFTSARRSSWGRLRMLFR